MRLTREQVIHDLQALADDFRERDGAEPMCLREAVRYISAAQPTGKWTRYITSYHGDKKDGMSFRCSECGRRIVYVHPDWKEQKFEDGLAEFLAEYPYCHCGAKMEVQI